MFYKKEIDGLRAIAVFAVIFYHASLQLLGYRLLPGGFLGVDVFFAISGFLIAFVLLEKNTPLLPFFKSRFDRIYPSLVLILVGCCVAAYLWLTPGDMLKFLGTLKGALGFYSNHVFAAEDSYVSDSSHYKPLIHTWSLAVEWQFYCLIPFAILAGKRLLGQRYPVLLGVLLALSLFAVFYMSKVNQTKAFYFGIYRFWEMLAGVITYLLFKKKGLPKAWDAWLATAAIALIVACITLFDDKGRHPGWPNLLAIVGTCGFIYFSDARQAVAKLLNLKIAAYFGLISYTLYIVHQPVFAFYRVAFAEINNRSFIALVVVIVAISALVYHAYEAPMRKSRHPGKYAIIALAVSICLGFVWMGQRTNGFTNRQPEAIRDALTNYAVPEFRRLQQQPAGYLYRSKAPIEQCINRMPASACNFGNVAAIALGDSNVGMYEYALQNALSQQGQGILSLSYEQCPFYNQPIWSGNVPECWEINKERWKLLKAYPSRPPIVISANFYQFGVAKRALDSSTENDTQPSTPVPEDEVYASFNASVQQLLELGYPVIVIADVPNPPFDVKKEMERRAMERTWSNRDETFAYAEKPMFDQRISKIAPHPGQRFALIRPDDFLCNKDKTQCLSISTKGGIYSFDSHLSNTGTHYVLPAVLRSMDEISRK